MRAHRSIFDRAGNGRSISSSARQRPKGAPAELQLLEVPEGRSWFYSIRTGFNCTIVEHRVSAQVFGGEAQAAKSEYVHHHQGLSHAEATRMKRALCGQGLIYAGGPL